MTLPSSEPVVEVRNLLVDNWDSNSVSIDQSFDEAWINTGWYDEETPNPQITLTNANEDTSPDGLTPNGLSAWVDGLIDCNVWVPQRNSIVSQNNPSTGVFKDFRWDLVRKVHSVIENNQTGTADGSGNSVLTRLETGQITMDPVEEPPPFRALIEVGYLYRTAP